jgi:hypothetical protein
LGFNRRDVLKLTGWTSKRGRVSGHHDAL